VFPKAAAEIGAPLLEVRGLGNDTEFMDISFSLHRGEVLGFYGLVGAGRTELMEALFGLTPPTHGEATLEGSPIARSPRESIDRGLVLVPEDRQHHGTFAALSIRLSIKHANLEQSLSELSGGNQQKVVIGKWLATEPRVIILDEPTQGVDVGAKAAVHTSIGELVARGLGVILVSSELPEVMGVADRIAVMREGRLVCVLARAEFDAKVIVTAALGAARSSTESGDATAVRAS
jgi:rhamnose transport system ATP-binding protein